MQNSLVALFLFALGPRERAHIDFQSGSGNAVSIGLACNLTRGLQLSPSLYITNDTPHQSSVTSYPLHLSHLAAEDDAPLKQVAAAAHYSTTPFTPHRHRFRPRLFRAFPVSAEFQPAASRFSSLPGNRDQRAIDPSALRDSATS